MKASNPGLCTRPHPLGDWRGKPEESHPCLAVGVNATCDDGDED
eukprot:COSAG05_NODE_23011_length_261_cov_0.549383_1_plen_43_part_10